MIRIVKPTAPDVLLIQGAAETQSLCDAYDRGERQFDFKSGIYAATAVKDALRLAQHDKCAFCESKFAHVGFGDVEHFRPKATFVQKDGDPLERPGYYWLAYAWSNLFLSCQLCNQRFKRNLFPIRNPRRRARSHHHNLGDEDPLFLDPGATHPTRHIGFRDEIAYPINGSKAGQATIQALGLNRSELVEVRRAHLVLLQTLQSAIHAFRALRQHRPLSAEEQEKLTQAEARLAALTNEASCYTAMSRVVRRQSPGP